jgi:hypothetical protein
MNYRVYLYVILSATVALSACKSGEEETEEPAAQAEQADEGEAGEEAEPAAAAKSQKSDLTAEGADGEATVAKGAGCDAPVELTKLDEKTVLSADGGGCFLVKGDLRVNGAESSLTIEPGVTVKFAENAGLTVSKGSLVATGTKAKPIVLTGEREMPGYWKGVLILNSERTENALEHVRIQFAGNANTYRSVEPAALMFDNRYGKSTFKIHHTELSNSDGHGLYVEHKTELDFADNTLTKNKAGAAQIDPDVVGHLDATSTYAGNEADQVTIMGRKITKLETTWPGIDAPYRVTGDLTFADDAFVTIGPGATFEFEENTGLSVQRARLNATGTADKPITLTGARQVPGFWKGVVVTNSDSIDNALEHVAIRFAGASKTYRSVEPAALMFDNRYGKSTFKIHHTELSNSDGHGLYVEHKTDLDFADNTLTKNKAGAANVDPDILGQLDAASTYAGNEADEVTVRSRTIKGLEVTWPGIDAPYRMTGDVTIGDGSFVTVAPGARLTFDENTGLSVHKAKLMAKGTADEPITFSGTRATSGFWKGIVVTSSSSIDNVFAHVIIEHAGSTKNFRSVQPAGLMFDNRYGQVSFQLDDVTVRDSAAGLYVEDKVELKGDCASIKLETEPKLAEDSKKLEEVCKA